MRDFRSEASMIAPNENTARCKPAATAPINSAMDVEITARCCGMKVIKCWPGSATVVLASETDASSHAYAHEADRPIGEMNCNLSALSA